jgi:hypothetical protein
MVGADGVVMGDRGAGAHHGVRRAVPPCAVLDRVAALPGDN